MSSTTTFVHMAKPEKRQLPFGSTSASVVLASKKLNPGNYGYGGFGDFFGLGRLWAYLVVFCSGPEKSPRDKEPF